jgi:ABC-2 type transport system permease protein
MTSQPASAARPLPPPAVTAGGHAPLRAFIASRLVEFCREPEALFWVYGFPLVMILSLGIAFRQQPLASLRVDVVAGPAAAADAATLNAAPGLTATIRPQAEAAERLRTGRADLVVERSAAAVEFRTDPTRPEAVLARDRAHDALERAAGRRDLLTVRDTPVESPGGRYIDFLVPGLMALSLMGGGLWGVGFAVVEMRIRKLLKRFFATPLAHWQFLFGMMAGRMLFVIPEMVLLVVAARLLFGVQVFGSAAAVVALLVLGATAFAGIGLAIAARAKTLEAVSGALNLIMLPMWLGSGVFFSRERYPDWLQPVLAALPLTPLVDALRGVMLEGRTLAGCAGEITAIAAWGIICFAIALRIFRWQ